MSPVRIAVYARVSTSDKGQTVENQLFDIRSLCATKGWNIVLEEQETISGTKAKKPILDRILAAAERKEFDVLIVWSLDRLTREGALRALQIIQHLSKFDVGFQSLQEPHFDTCGPLKDVLIAWMATWAKLERERISERIKACFKRKRKEAEDIGEKFIVGRPFVPREAENRIVEMYRSGADISTISKCVSYKRLTRIQDKRLSELINRHATVGLNLEELAERNKLMEIQNLDRSVSRATIFRVLKRAG